MIWLSNLNYTDPGIVAGLPIHFHAMVSKGLDPYWISNDAEHDGHDLFLYVHWLATERNSLGGEGYSYAVARQAVQFYVKNVHRLIDIPPRRLSLIAKMIADNPDPAERKERLEGMLRPTDQRPRLKVPESWVPVLLWPQNLPRRSDYRSLRRMNRTSSRRSQRKQSHRSVNRCRRQRMAILSMTRLHHRRRSRMKLWRWTRS